MTGALQSFDAMQAVSTLAAFALVHLVVVATPGPAFFAVTRVAVSASRRAGLIAAWAMCCGALIWALATLLGLHVLFEKAPWLYNAMRLGGAAYLIYMGLGMLRAAWRGGQAAPAQVMETAAAGRATFLNCLGVQLSNPKAAVYFGSVFVTLLPEAAPLWFKAVVMALMGCMEFGWYALVVLVLSAPRARRVYVGAKRALDAVFGGVLTLLGIKLALVR
jgi:threonine/homoserine/homoserine lactone efflux protein